MFKRYVLKVIDNENDLIDVKKDQFACIYTPDPEDCFGFVPSTKLKHLDDIFEATFFKTKDKAKTAVKKYGPWGVEYYITEVQLTIS